VAPVICRADTVVPLFPQEDFTMCLGVPGQILSIDGSKAILDVWGSRVEVRLDLLDQVVSVGDYVLEHAGVAVRVITPELVLDTLGQYEIILSEAGCDPIALDVAAELTFETGQVRR
jgi:hydrogenase expression/formation protein HypC